MTFFDIASTPVNLGNMAAVLLGLVVAVSGANALFVRLTIKGALSDWSRERNKSLDERFDRMERLFVRRDECNLKHIPNDRAIEEHDQSIKNLDHRVTKLEARHRD